MNPEEFAEEQDAQTDAQVIPLPGTPSPMDFDYLVQGGHDDLVWLRCNLGVDKLSGFFLRGGKVVYTPLVNEDGYIAPRYCEDDNGPATITELDGQTLSTRINDRMTVVKRKQGEFHDAWFPTDVCTRALKTADELLYLRPLRGVTHTPLARPGEQGGVMNEPGYDDTTGFLYIPAVQVKPVSLNPTREEIDRATALLRGMISEFAWVGEHDEANYLGAMLTPLLRLVCPPPYQLLAIMARERGSGKSLLAELLRLVHGGALRSFPTSEEEVGKVITSILTQTTGPVVQMDNVRGRVNSSKLEALLTSAEYSDRLLGSNDNARMVNDRLWVATGNNMSLVGDLDRRTLWVAIDPKMERPEERTEFAIPDLPGYVKEHRGEILWALLTWVSAWQAAGCPVDPPTADSYGRWISTVRGIFDVVNMPGTFAHKDSRQVRSNEDHNEWGQMLVAIHDIWSDGQWTVRQVVERLMKAKPDGVSGGTWGGDDKANALMDSLPTELHKQAVRDPQNITRTLGNLLAMRHGQWFDGLTVRQGTKGKYGMRWSIATAGNQD